MLEFHDTTGCRWEVFEVKRSVVSQGGVSHGRESGWLSFHNGLERRRLAPVPPDWSTSSPYTLTHLLGQATVVAPWKSPGPDIPGLERRSVARDTTPSALDHVVREVAIEARASGETVVAALLRLRTVLAQHGIDRDAPEARTARKLFLDVFYFAARDR